MPIICGVVNPMANTKAQAKTEELEAMANGANTEDKEDIKKLPKNMNLYRVTQEDIDSVSDELMMRLDAMFMWVKVEDKQLDSILKVYKEWRKNQAEREKQEAIEALKAKARELGLSPDELLK
jgi:glycerol-3-phosphate dehydrogenase